MANRHLFLTAVLLLVSGARMGTPAQQQPDRTISDAGPCGPLGKSHLRTTLYFGTTHPAGGVTDTQWKVFLRDQVTPRFPAGFTVWEANGQWRKSDGHIARERAKVMLVVHEDSPAVREALAALVSDYKRAFRQESVLWETTSVCAAF